MGQLAIPLIIGIASAAGGIASSIEQNNAVKKANEANARNAEAVRQANIDLARAQEADKQRQLAKEYDLYSGAVKARATELGGSGGAGMTAIQRALLFGTTESSANARVNLSFQENAIVANTVPTIIPQKSIFFSSLNSVIGGVSTGLSIAGALQGLQGAGAANAMATETSTLQYGSALQATGMWHQMPGTDPTQTLPIFSPFGLKPLG